MTKKFFSTMVAVAIFVGVFGLLRFANADTDARDTTTTVVNQAPIITVTPSDGGSNTGTATADPTASGSDVTFTVTAKDVNSDDYYAAFCSIDAITGGSSGAPSCAASHEWAISTATDGATPVQASVTYTTGSNTTQEGADCTSAEECPWFAFTCDDAATGLCFPAGGSGDQGSSVGTVTFDDVPTDGDNITIDSITYEFDDDSSFTGTQVDISGSEDGAGTAAALVAADVGTHSTMYSRGNVVYVYADVEGDSLLSMTENQDTSGYIAISDFTGGDDDNASPFAINHAPNIASYAYGDTTGGGNAHASGTVEPGDTVYFSIDIDDLDEKGGQDTIDMYVCDTNSFTPGSGCASSHEICKSLAVSATDAAYAECSSATIATIPTANATYTVYVFAEDQHQYQATYTSGNQTRTYDVEDTPPYLDTSYGTSPGTGYQAATSPAPSASGSDPITFSFGIKDDNGDNDITNARGVFFDDSVTHACSSDENTCYIDTDCTLDTASTPGSGKTADGIDNTRVATCTVTVWFNATAGNWDVNGNATDAADEVAFADAGSSLAVPTLQGIDVVTMEIAYSTVAIGGTSSGQETSIGNVGNQVLDVQISGTAMDCNTSATCGTNTIAAAQQKWHNTSSTFDWDDTAADPGPWTLVTTPSGTNEAGGCANRDIAVRNDHSSLTETNESIWWKIRIPAAQAAGGYDGSNTFTSTASTTCSTASLH